MAAPLTEGWAWLFNSRKAHYYGTDKRSLCGRWALLFYTGGFEANGAPSEDDCATCRKKVDKRTAQSHPT